MAIKTFITDEEMNKLVSGNKISTPEFIPDSESDKYFGGQKKTNILSEFAGGVVKPFGEIGERLLEPVTKGIRKITGLEIQTPTKYRETEVDTPAFKVGEFVGETSQFAVGGVIGKATKLPLIYKMIAEGVSAGTVASLQKGEIDKTSLDVALLSSLFPGVGKIASNTRIKIGSNSAGRVINSLIKPLKKDVSYGKNPGRAVAKEGIIANSLDELETKINEKLTKRIDQLNTKLKKSKMVVDVSDTLSPIDKAIQTATKQNNQGLVNRLQKTKQALTDNLDLITDEGGNQIIKSTGLKNLTNLSAEEATRFKRDIGEITAFTGNPSDDKLVNSALKQVYGGVRSKIEKVLPETKQLNERIADLISARTATKYRSEIAERQNLIKFTPKVIGTTGLITSFATGNVLPFVISLGEIGVQKALETPRAKTELAKWLASASTQQKREIFQKAPWFKAVIQNTLLDNVESTENSKD